MIGWEKNTRNIETFSDNITNQHPLHLDNIPPKNGEGFDFFNFCMFCSYHLFLEGALCDFEMKLLLECGQLLADILSNWIGVGSWTHNNERVKFKLIDALADWMKEELVLCRSNISVRMSIY